ncbi:MULTISPECIES: zinc-ribbon domain containing protein [unclassified Schlesneria]|uniref:zinc-ribbon domain containing protein n=1 Tax=unclassified Schlesneria TaxID=2762017 RepID=UPI0035C78EDF
MEYYEDTRFQCIDCGLFSIWTAKQQQWWYEVAKGSMYSIAVRCRECREKLRDRHGGTPRRSHLERRRTISP